MISRSPLTAPLCSRSAGIKFSCRRFAASRRPSETWKVSAPGVNDSASRNHTVRRLPSSLTAPAVRRAIPMMDICRAKTKYACVTRDGHFDRESCSSMWFRIWYRCGGMLRSAEFLRRWPTTRLSAIQHSLCCHYRSGGCDGCDASPMCLISCIRDRCSFALSRNHAIRLVARR